MSLPQVNGDVCHEHETQLENWYHGRVAPIVAHFVMYFAYKCDLWGRQMQAVYWFSIQQIFGSFPNCRIARNCREIFFIDFSGFSVSHYGPYGLEPTSPLHVHSFILEILLGW